jgi:hypothetical protein
VIRGCGIAVVGPVEFALSITKFVLVPAEPALPLFAEPAASTGRPAKRPLT